MDPGGGAGVPDPEIGVEREDPSNDVPGFESLSGAPASDTSEMGVPGAFSEAPTAPTKEDYGADHKAGEASLAGEGNPEDGRSDGNEAAPESPSGGREELDGNQLNLAEAIYIGETINQYLNEKPSFEEVASTTLGRLKAIFVEPDGFTLGHTPSRIFLLHGSDHSGKWTCAVNLALRLSERSAQGPLKIFQYLRPKSSQLPLAAALSRGEWPRDSVVILRECFERNVSHDDLEAAQLYELVRPLEEKNGILILTGNPQHELIAVAAEKVHAQLPPLALRKVFENNLRYDVEAGELLVSKRLLSLIFASWGDLSRFLLTPFHISQFVLKLRSTVLREMDEDALKPALALLAQQVSAAGGQVTRVWFSSLQPNEMLFALLVHLFDGAERTWLEYLVDGLIRELRQNGFGWFSDPRTTGLDDTREKVHAVERDGRLEIEGRIYEREVQAQVRNRRTLLWDVVERLVELEPRKEWTDPWRRRGLGVALSRLGVHDEQRFASVLETLGADNNRLRAVVAGYALQETLRADPVASIGFVTKVVDDWITSRDPHLMWSAGAALWRLYQAAAKCAGDEQRRLLKLVTELAENHRRFELEGIEKEQEPRVRHRHLRSNASCVVEAMRQIALIDPNRAADQLRAWFDKSRSELPALAREAVLAIYERFAKGRQKPTEAHQRAFIGLLTSLLEHGDTTSFAAEVGFLTLRAWLKWPEVEPKAGAELLRLARHPSARVRERVRSTTTRLWLDPRPTAARRVAEKLARRWAGNDDVALRRDAKALSTFWCEDPDGRTRAHRMAQAVAARSTAADGALPLLASTGRAIVVVDPALLLAGDAREAIDGFLWTVLALLDSHLDLTVLRLGEVAPLRLGPQPEEAAIETMPADACRSPEAASLAGLDLWPSFPTHRLVMPGVLTANASHSVHRGAPRPDVVLLATEMPHDADDLVDAPWSRRLYLVSAGDERGETPSADALRLTVSWPPSGEDLSLVISAFEREWAREIPTAPPERWGDLLRSFGIEEPEGADVDVLLGAWAAGLDSYLPETTGRQDSMAKSVALLLYLAVRNLQKAFARIVDGLLYSPHPADPARGDEPLLAEGPSGEGSSLRRAVAAAAAFALIRLYTAFPPGGGGSVCAPTPLFESLAEPLAAIGPDGIAAVVRLVCHWFEDPVWTEYLAGDVRDGRGRLERWAARWLSEQPELSAELTERLARSRPKECAEASWISLSSIIGRLEKCRENEYPPELPPLDDGQRYVLLVVDPAPSGGAGDRRALLRKLAADLYGAIRGRQDGLVPLIYRLGDRRLFWAAAEAPLVGRLGLPAPGPRLIGPTLVAAAPRFESVASVLLLVATEPLDLDDWADSAWWSKLTLYGAGAPSPTASFAAIPRPLRRGADVDGADDASRITVRLGELAGGQGAAGYAGGA